MHCLNDYILSTIGATIPFDNSLQCLSPWSNIIRNGQLRQLNPVGDDSLFQILDFTDLGASLDLLLKGRPDNNRWGSGLGCRVATDLVWWSCIWQFRLLGGLEHIWHKGDGGILGMGCLNPPFPMPFLQAIVKRDGLHTEHLFHH